MPFVTNTKCRDCLTGNHDHCDGTRAKSVRRNGTRNVYPCECHLCQRFTVGMVSPLWSLEADGLNIDGCIALAGEIIKSGVKAWGASYLTSQDGILWCTKLGLDPDGAHRWALAKYPEEGSTLRVGNKKKPSKPAVYGKKKVDNQTSTVV